MLLWCSSQAWVSCCLQKSLRYLLTEAILLIREKQTIKQRKPEIGMISRVPVFQGAWFGSCGCTAQLWCFLVWGEREVQVSEAMGVFSHSPTTVTVSMCLGHHSNWIANLFLQQVMDIIPGYACLVYLKSSWSLARLGGMGINATFISCLQQMKFRLFWLKNMALPLLTYTAQIYRSEFL